MKKFLNSFKFAMNGIFLAFKSQRNMKIHVSIMAIVIFMGFVLKIKIYEWLICLLLFGLVLSMEIINTSIEKIVDLVSPSYNELAKKIKDLSAGAVLTNALIAFISGIIIFMPYIINIINR